MVREKTRSLSQSTTPQKSKKPFPVHILVFLAPAVIIYTAFMIIPLLGSLGLGFFTQNETGSVVFAGLDNYIRLLTDPLWSPRLWGALRNNVIFFIVHMCVQNPIGLFLAALISSQLIGSRAATIYRSLIFTPTVLSVVLVGFIWRLILSPVWGVADDLLAAVGIQSQPWLGLETTALPVLSLISVWQWVGIPMMLFLAALMGIPDEIVEAARVDGATAWSVFWRIKFPLILPTVGIVGVLTFVGNFNAFDLIYTTQTALAGPNFSTDILGTLFYRTFFGFQLQLGNDYMGAAVAGVMFVIIAAGVLAYLFGWQRRILKMDIQL
ncbi:MAG: sugar ABC transporter permease [Anaerolineae bacterium]|jgi:raffinose/stachyose/melibiose transport system permease protein|uniref:carbohydrate ABC transporter permease n=1 Tax=Candidatus Flexifilum breve TaxID=3140694 RepID=UPI001AD2CA72|nr:sugar ABC transporter permease [Chloroflexota bacterium]MBK9748006.1 sugar ABC transporter permease [Chloroflexota bacterium]MBN8633711.1 sugar ABC transporter permease [Anaerolineae bacterium]